MAEYEIPQEVKELTPELWGQWKQHPMTRLLHQYLRDAAELVKQEHLDRWMRNAANDPVMEAQYHKGMELFLEIADLTVDDIHNLYGYVPPSNVKK